MQAYAATLVPPSTALVAACALLKTNLVAAFSAGDAGPGLMDTAFQAFGASLALGIVLPIVPTPPPAAVGFATQFAGPMPSTCADAASQVFAIINTWMHTGSGVIAPAAAILWS